MEEGRAHGQGEGGTSSLSSNSSLLPFPLPLLLPLLQVAASLEKLKVLLLQLSFLPTKTEEADNKVGSEPQLESSDVRLLL